MGSKKTEDADMTANIAYASIPKRERPTLFQTPSTWIPRNGMEGDEGDQKSAGADGRPSWLSCRAELSSREIERELAHRVWRRVCGEVLPRF
jgi:hypothetical protein